MAVTYTIKDPAGLPACSPGQDGYVLLRLILDGSATSKAITLPSTHPMKTIKGCVGGSVASDGIGAGVAATTGFTLTFAAGTNGHGFDVLLYGSGR